jgi:hypothetical protein
MLIQGVLTKYSPWHFSSSKHRSTSIIERIPCSGIVSEISSGSFDYAPVTFEFPEFLAALRSR